MQTQHHSNIRGFTLIEISIVLVIVGLLVGGVIVGRDMIDAARVRSQISQIEKYKTAVNTFRLKYGYLPGDIPNPTAAAFGFAARGQYAGQGDGNGIIEGSASNDSDGNRGWTQAAGETVLFWRDLSEANLIEGNFTLASATVPSVSGSSKATFAQYYPQAKVRDGMFVLAYSSGHDTNSPPPTWNSTGKNYFSVQGIDSIGSGGAGQIGLGTQTGANGAQDNTYRFVYSGVWGMQVSAAFAMDSKLDDGYPHTGKVLAKVVLNSIAWVEGPAMVYNTGGDHNWTADAPYVYAVAATSSNCYDNGGVNNTAQRYSMSINSGSSQTCSLSFEF